MDDIRYKDMIETIYKTEEKALEQKINEANKKINERIKDINVDKLLENTSKPKDLTKALETIQENYSIKIEQYNKDFYKQGFIDGVNIMINCLKI